MTNQDELLSKLTIDRSAGPEPAGRGYMLWGTVVLAAIAGGIWAFVALGHGAQDKAETAAVAPGPEAAPQKAAAPLTDITAPPVERVAQMAPASASRAGVVLDASGYVTARRIATVSAEITGLIREVLIEEGMAVAQGQVLARLDDAIASADFNVARAQVRQAQADVATVAANLAEAERELVRATALRRDEFASEARVTQADASVAALKASLEAARARVEINRFQSQRLEERLADHTIRAPFPGVVTVKAAQPGEIVSPVSAGGGFTRTGICTIVDMASLEIEVDVNESFIGRIREGQKVVANLDAYPDWDIQAWVIAIIPTANRDKATVRVRVGIETGDPRILPDMGVRVAFLDSDA